LNRWADIGAKTDTVVPLQLHEEIVFIHQLKHILPPSSYRCGFNSMHAKQTLVYKFAFSLN